MRFNLVCFFAGHKTHRYIERDVRRKDGLWRTSERRELLACERCGERNPNHPAFDLLPTLDGAADSVIAKAKERATTQGGA